MPSAIYALLHDLAHNACRVVDSGVMRSYEGMRGCRFALVLVSNELTARSDEILNLPYC
uniref:Uncharacterized protein n=1 Tax=Candidatus Methanogaster sp. ANME-2c ERB4 TaxID=2759911 RepID=A0A7G9YHZ6_9EURY|nr:hypothetical protein PGBELJNO_00028 [Methanosarcinales archaeon ANME-2c ERB4]